MFRLFVRIFCISTGAVSFYFFAEYFNRTFAPEQKMIWPNRVGFMVAGLLMGVLLSPYIQHNLLSLHKQILKTLRRLTPEIAFKGFFGLIAGFGLSVLFSVPFSLYLQEHRFIGLAMAVLGGIVFGYLGVIIFVNIRFPGIERVDTKTLAGALSATPKVIDSSVLIDGRILDLCRKRFIEGTLYLPTAALEELQKVADSSDDMRRKKGRRGLEIAQKIRDETAVTVEVPDLDSFGISGGPVDSRLVSFAEAIGAVLVTNDYNLMKVAELREVVVWNLNDLAAALRKTLLPGEKMEVNVVKFGKEVGQGIAYLDDGTMIVIEGADKFVGESIEIEIKSMLQTVAGRLIFAGVSRPPDHPNSGGGGG